MIVTLAMVMHLLPPPKYNYEPKVPYTITEFHEGNEPLIFKVLCQVQKGHTALGCTIKNKIYIRDDLTGKVYDIILAHEKAHVNGWKHK